MPVLVAQLLVLLLCPLFVATVLLGLPGIWMALAVAALCEWLTGPPLFHAGTLAAAGGLALLAELWEFLAGAARAKRAGAGHAGAIGALVGGIAGAVLGTLFIPVPLVGTLAGGGIGAFTFASLLEHGRGRELRDAMRIGRAAGIGHVLGLVGKLAIGVGVYVVLAVAVLVP